MYMNSMKNNTNVMRKSATCPVVLMRVFLLLLGFIISQIVMPKNAVAQPPAAPTGVTATPGNGRVDIAWTAVTGADKYLVYRSRTPGNSYLQVRDNGVSVSWTDTDVSNNTFYYYVVVNYDNAVLSAYSTEVSATPGIATAPENFRATADSTQAFLEWLPVASASKYKLWCASDAVGPYILVSDSINGTLTRYTHTGLANGTTYYYQIAAANTNTESVKSPIASVTPYLRPPSNVVAIGKNIKVSLSWGPVLGATSYNIYRSTSIGGPYTYISNSDDEIQYDLSVLNGTTYYYVINTVRNSTQSANSLEVSAKPNPLPSVPTALAAAAGNGRVSLTWNAVAIADSYRIFRKPSGGSFSQIAASVVAAYLDTSAVNGTTYSYYVQSVNGEGASSNSSQVNAIPKLTPPTGFTATALSTRVGLAWQPVANATGYKVKMGTTSGSYPNTQSVSGNNTTSYVWTGLSNGTTYYFAVEATASVSAASSSNSTQAIAVPQLGVPTGLSATPAPQQVSLSWTAVAGAASYQVWRSTTSGGPYISVGTPTNASFNNNTGLANGTPYYYVVKAVSGSTVTGASSQVSATPLAAPLAPTGVVANAGCAQVSLSWGPVNTATSYIVERKVSGGSFSPLITQASTNFIDTTAINGTTYVYRVNALNSTVPGVYSSEVTAQPRVVAPTNLVAVVQAGQVSLTWNSVASITKYRVKRKTSAGSAYATLTEPTQPNYLDTGLNGSTTYYYVVVAVDLVGESTFSNEVIVTPGQPAVPTNLAATSGNQQVTLSWNTAANATSYKIKRSASQSGPFTLITTISGTTYTDLGLTNGATYYYVVSGLNGSMESANSA